MWIAIERGVEEQKARREPEAQDMIEIIEDVISCFYHNNNES